MAKKCPKTREYVMNFHCVCVFPARQTLRNVTHEIFFLVKKTLVTFRSLKHLVSAQPSSLGATYVHTMSRVQNCAGQEKTQGLI